MTDRPIALVTGASRGIGRATARRLAGDHDILAIARSEADLQSLAHEIDEAGGRCRPVPLDVTDAEAVQRTLGDERVDVLVNNAGVGTLRPLLELTVADWRRMVSVNLDSLFYVTRAVLPGMVERGSGWVVNIGSLAGRNAFVGGSCYAATKHAVMGFTESLMLEVRQQGVRVAVVMPGSVATGFFPEGTDTSWMLTPEQVAETVWFMVSRAERHLISRVEMRPARPPR